MKDEKKLNLIGGAATKPDVWEKEIPNEGEQFEAAKLAAAGCPVDAIQVLDENGTLVEGPEQLPIEDGQAPKEAPKRAEAEGTPA